MEVCGQLYAYSSGERVPRIHRIGGGEGIRVCLDTVQREKFLTLL